MSLPAEQDPERAPDYGRVGRPLSGEVRAALLDFANRLNGPDPILKGLLAPDTIEEHINALSEVERRWRAPLTLDEQWLLDPTWLLADGTVVKLTEDVRFRWLGSQNPSRDPPILPHLLLRNQQTKMAKTRCRGPRRGAWNRQ